MEDVIIHFFKTLALKYTNIAIFASFAHSLLNTRIKSNSTIFLPYLLENEDIMFLVSIINHVKDVRDFGDQNYQNFLRLVETCQTLLIRPSAYQLTFIESVISTINAKIVDTLKFSRSSIPLPPSTVPNVPISTSNVPPPPSNPVNPPNVPVNVPSNVPSNVPIPPPSIPIIAEVSPRESSGAEEEDDSFSFNDGDSFEEEKGKKKQPFQKKIGRLFSSLFQNKAFNVSPFLLIDSLINSLIHSIIHSIHS